MTTTHLCGKCGAGIVEVNPDRCPNCDMAPNYKLCGLPVFVTDMPGAQCNWTMAPLPEWIEVDRGEIPPTPSDATPPQSPSS